MNANDAQFYIAARLNDLAAETEAEMKTTTGIGIRRAILELRELRDELFAVETMSQ